MSLLADLNHFSILIGNTPTCQLKGYDSLYAKLEYNNCMGSIKDRPALYILQKAIITGKINRESTIIESTSGNFGIALASICRHANLKFIPVIDPNIVIEKETVLRLLSHDIIKVQELDRTGGYLLSRIQTVKKLLLSIPNSFNPNQYENPDNYLAYYHTLGNEIISVFDKLDYLFVSVSSGGTLTGLSLRLKEKYKKIQIIAVDVEGSVIFTDKPAPRQISGMGASQRSQFIDKAHVDDVVILSQLEIIEGCYAFLNEQGILAGPSSGAAYLAASRYLHQRNAGSKKALIICPDRGNSYLDTLFNKDWVNTIGRNKKIVEAG